MSPKSLDRFCPRDGSPLEIRTWKEVAHASCPRCHGIHIGRSELERLIRFHAGSPPAEPAATAEDIAIVEGTALCSCQGQPLMKQITRDGVSLDVCPSCGAFWFDPGEIETYMTVRQSSRAAERSTHRRVSKPEDDEGIGRLVWRLFEAVVYALRSLSSW